MVMVTIINSQVTLTHWGLMMPYGMLEGKSSLVRKVVNFGLVLTYELKKTHYIAPNTGI